MQTTGSKAQVWHGTAKHTSGGLTKGNLMKNKHGRIVSKRKHTLGKKSIKNLKKLGYVAKKGQFKLFHKHTSKKGHSRKMRGGMNQPNPSLGATQLGTTQPGTSLGATQPGATQPSTSLAAAVKAMKGGMNHPSATLGVNHHAAAKAMKGGMPYGGYLSPHSYDGKGEGTSGVALQFVAGNSG